MVKRSSVGKGLESIKQTAAAKPAKTKKKSAANGNGMNGPHRPKLLGANVEEDVHRAFKSLAVEQGTSIQRLVCEGLNLVLEKNGSKVRTAIE